MSNEVDDWFAAYQNPMKATVARVREIMLAADPRIEECIKWKSPTFTYKGNLLSFNPRAKKFASAIIHQGALIPGEHPRLLGEGKTARSMRFTDVEDANAAQDDLNALVAAWIKFRDGAMTEKKKK